MYHIIIGDSLCRGGVECAEMRAEHQTHRVGTSSLSSSSSSSSSSSYILLLLLLLLLLFGFLKNNIAHLLHEWIP